MDINDSPQLRNAPDYHSPEGLADFGANHWSNHALTERPAKEVNESPGGRWGRDVALVPVHQLARYREYDRTGKHSHGPISTNAISNISKDLKKGGVEAMREPLFLEYNHDMKWGYLGEGHHRLEAAIQAGLTHVPVRVMSSHSMSPNRKRDRIGAPLHMDNRLQEKGQGGYYPSQLHPGNFQEFEGAR